MAVQTQQTVFPYVANGATTVFPYGCRILDQGDLIVQLDGVTKTLGADYTVSGVGAANGGSVTFSAAPANLASVKLIRSTRAVRLTDYQTAGDFLASTVNPDFDRPYMVVQDILQGGVEIGNTVRVPAGETITKIPSAAVRANTLFAWDASGNPSTALPAAGTATALGLQLLSSVGATIVGWLRSATGAVARLVSDKLAEHVSVTDFMTAAQITDAQGSSTLDVAGRASLNAAIASLSSKGGIVDIPNGLMVPCNGTLTWYNGVQVKGRSQWGSGIKYTAAAGILCDLYGVTGAAVRRLRLVTDAGGTSQAFRVYGNQCLIEDVFVGELTNGSGTGWAKTGSVESDTALANRSNSNVLSNIYMNAVRTSGITITRAVDTFLDKIRSAGIANTTTYQHIILDTGASGVYMDRVSLYYGLHGVVHQHTQSTGTGPWNVPPLYIFGDQVLCDTMTGGDGFYFDASLGAATTSAKYTNCWAAGNGKNSSGANITITARGVGVYGGQGIEWHGRARANAASGAAVNSANCANVNLRGDFTSNNQANNADEHGIYFVAGGENLTVKDARCGNTLDLGGFQKYGVKIAAGIGASWSVQDCNLKDNVTGPASFLSVNNGSASGNVPADNTLDTIVGTSRILLGGGGWIHSKKIVALANGGTLTPDFTFQAATVTVRNSTSGKSAIFFLDAVSGGTKLSGDASIVIGAPAASQLGVNQLTGVVTQGYAGAQDVYQRVDALQ